MQFLESSVIGLRSAFYELESPNKKIKFFIFPMIHVGDPSYYKEIQKRLEGCDNIVFEGVKSSKTWFIVQAYSIMAKRKSLGIVTQREALKIKDKGFNLIHGDISTEDFEKSWKNIPLFFRLGILILAPLYGCLQYLVANRNSLASNRNVDSFPAYDKYFDDEAKQAFEKTILDDRDKILVDVLKKHIDSNIQNKESTAVIYGAKHMPIVLSLLTRFYDYKVTKSEWVQAI